MSRDADGEKTGLLEEFDGRPVVERSMFGTSEAAWIWLNTHDSAGILLASFVWAVILYCNFVIVAIVLDGAFALTIGIVFTLFCFMALWCHAKTMFADPGAIPGDAQPFQHEIESGIPITMCGRCDAYKPPGAHHCRISNRCIMRMDHFCPWMNNAIGARNQKHFFLFLIYTDAASIFALVLLGYHLFLCLGWSCSSYSTLDSYMVKSMVVFLLFSLLFTSSMLTNQIYGVVTGVGTIDRMKMKRGQQVRAKPIPFKDVFGVGFVLLHALPTNPVFDDEDRVMRYRRGGRWTRSLNPKNDSTPKKSPLKPNPNPNPNPNPSPTDPDTDTATKVHTDILL